jgi:methyltransferase (TIGR00027 family)
MLHLRIVATKSSGNSYFKRLNESLLQIFRGGKAMILKRHSQIKNTNEVWTWENHYARHVNPKLMTELLQKAVPVLEHVHWEVTEVRQGFAETLLPLSSESTNQHGTHQAALIALSADYTGGLALASLLTGIPLAGIHRCDETESASLWLADMSLRFKAPSTGHLIARCQVPQSSSKRITSRYFSGKKVFVTLPVEFYSNGELVAEAAMKYFVQPSIQLSTSSSSTNASPIFHAKLKASARMIAGVRALPPKNRQIRLDCPHTANAATEHGHLLAKRLESVLPQLPDMVHARTKHGDQTIESIAGLKQVVLLGAGLDMRPYRLHARVKNVRWFELDLPPMIEERNRVISLLKKPPRAFRRSIAMDLTTDSIDDLLLAHPDFDPKAPTLIIYEGCSMYFDADLNHKILAACARVMQHPESRLWCDIVDESVIHGENQTQPVLEFLDGMDELGEKFIFGHSNPEVFLKQAGLSRATVVSCAEVLGEDQTVYDQYRFLVAGK